MAQLKKAIGALFCVLCLVVPLTSGESVDFRNCSITTPVATVNGLDVSPFPVPVGQTFNFTINASTDTKIARGVLIISTLRGFVPIEQVLNLCETTTCPITAGTFTIYLTLPAETEPGRYRFKIEAFDQTVGTPLICISFAIGVVP